MKIARTEACANPQLDRPPTKSSTRGISKTDRLLAENPNKNGDYTEQKPDSEPLQISHELTKILQRFHIDGFRESDDETGTVDTTSKPTRKPPERSATLKAAKPPTSTVGPTTSTVGPTKGKRRGSGKDNPKQVTIDGIVACGSNVQQAAMQALAYVKTKGHGIKRVDDDAEIRNGFDTSGVYWASTASANALGFVRLVLHSPPLKRFQGDGYGFADALEATIGEQRFDHVLESLGCEVEDLQRAAHLVESLAGQGILEIAAQWRHTAQLPAWVSAKLHRASVAIQLLRLIVALTECLSRCTGEPRPTVFLSRYEAARILSKDPSTCGTALGVLVEHGIIEVVKRGTTKRIGGKRLATEYRIVWELQTPAIVP